MYESNFEIANKVVDKYQHEIRKLMEKIAVDTVRAVPKEYTYVYDDSGQSCTIHEDAIVVRALVKSFMFQEIEWEFLRKLLLEEITYRKE